MALFWGKKDEKMEASVQKKQEPVDPRTAPLEIGVTEGPHGFATIDASYEFRFLLRNMMKGIKDNNDMICEMYDRQKEILKEMRVLRERLDKLEGRVYQEEQIAPLHRVK